MVSFLSILLSFTTQYLLLVKTNITFGKYSVLLQYTWQNDTVYFNNVINSNSVHVQNGMIESVWTRNLSNSFSVRPTESAFFTNLFRFGGFDLILSDFERTFFNFITTSGVSFK